MRDNPELPFPIDEYRRRIKKVQAGIADRGIDACLVSIPENIYYLTGFTTTGYYMYQTLVIPAEGDPMFVCYLEEKINILRRSWLDRYMTYSVIEDPIEVTLAALREMGLEDKVLALEEKGLFFPIATYKQLMAAFPRARWKDGSGIVEQARLVKSPLEVNYIRQAAKAARAGMVAAIAAVEPGKTENDIAAEVYRATLQNGSEYPGSPPYVVSGERSGLPHGTWEGRVLREGDIVFLEHSGCIKRYSAAMMRTCFIGDPPDVVRRHADIILEGLQKAIDTIRPGVTSGEVDFACRNTITSAGFPNYTHETGYSIGVAYPPGWNECHIMNLHPGDPTVLVPNMVFHLVPSLIIPEIQGHVGFSDTVLVTENGCEVLTNVGVERKLYVLEPVAS
ncbi:MAG TPA: Xaa-Pro peptidase family protein [Thermoanaerobaculia bacterium]|nr:Xaa-Pro peptidase family protein [Thermoanaerobaculia bacterium]